MDLSSAVTPPSADLPTPLPIPADAFPFFSPPRDPTRQKIAVLHDLTANSDAALRFVLREIFSPKEGRGIDILVICVCSDAVLKRAGFSRPRGSSFSRFLGNKDKDRAASASSSSHSIRGTSPPRPSPVPLSEAAQEFNLEITDELLSAPTQGQEVVGATLEERIQRVVLTTGELNVKTPISLVVLPQSSTSTLHTVLRFLRSAKPSLLVAASKGHTSGLVDTLVHQGVSKGLLSGWDGPLCLVRMGKDEKELASAVVGGMT